MRTASRRWFAAAVVAAVTVTGCGSDEPSDDQAAPEEQGTDEPGDESPDDEGREDGAPEGGAGDLQMEDPNEDVEDGVYRGNGVFLPVPDGFSLDQAAFAQGVLAAISEDGAQQLTAQAVDVQAAEEAGQDVGLDSLLDGIREQVGQEADVDEEVELEGAQRAHRLTFLDLPAAQEGGEESSATIILAEDGSGLIGEFIVGASSDAYDADLETLLLETAGFDPDSEPPAPPAPPEPQPAPDDGAGEEPADDLG